MNRRDRRDALHFGRPWYRWRALRRTRNREIIEAVSPFGFDVHENSREDHVKRYGSKREGRGIAGYRTHD